LIERSEGPFHRERGIPSPSATGMRSHVRSPRRRLPYGSKLASRPAPVVLNVALGVVRRAGPCSRIGQRARACGPGPGERGSDERRRSATESVPRITRRQDARPMGCCRPRARGHTSDRLDRNTSAGSTPETRIQLRGASVVARERSRGCGGGKVGPEMARMLLIRSCVSRLAAGDAYEGPEAPGNAAVRQGADANDGRPRGALVRGEKNRSPGHVGTKGSSDAGRQEEQRQQASKRLGATESVTHRQPHTGERVLRRIVGSVA
jgi:hypothetical protein